MHSIRSTSRVFVGFQTAKSCVRDPISSQIQVVRTSVRWVRHQAGAASRSIMPGCRNQQTQTNGGNKSTEAYAYPDASVTDHNAAHKGEQVPNIRKSRNLFLRILSCISVPSFAVGDFHRTRGFDSQGTNDMSNDHLGLWMFCLSPRRLRRCVTLMSALLGRLLKWAPLGYNDPAHGCIRQTNSSPPAQAVASL